MSEIICPFCNAQSPENALYCQHCGQPLRCQSCRTVILPTALVCTQCGKIIPERSTSDKFQLGISVVPAGYNRLKFHETPDVRDLDLMVSNDAIAQLGDLIPSLIGTRLKGHNGKSADNQPQKQADVVEMDSEMPSNQPQLPAVSSVSTLSKNS